MSALKLHMPGTSITQGRPGGGEIGKLRVAEMDGLAPIQQLQVISASGGDRSGAEVSIRLGVVTRRYPAGDGVMLPVGSSGSSGGHHAPWEKPASTPQGEGAGSGLGQSRDSSADRRRNSLGGGSQRRRPRCNRGTSIASVRCHPGSVKVP